MPLIGRILDSIFGAKPKPANRHPTPEQPASKQPTPRQPTGTPNPSTTASRVVVPAAASGAAARIADSNACWVPPSRTMKVRGRTIPGGLIYVGDRLHAVSGYASTEPALISPSLATDDGRPDRDGATLGYWPSYDKLMPAARAAYLDWLAAGRGPDAPIGFVFLFFYGLERRVLHDAVHDDRAKRDLPAIIDEVERLLGEYAYNDSFRGYANEFLTAARLQSGGTNLQAIEPPMKRHAWEMPLSARIGLGRIVAQQAPLPADWALSWLKCHPESRLRTPATRCPIEFGDLFRIRYRERFGAGITVPENKARLRATYRAASASFLNPVALPVGNIPDVAAVIGPLRKLQQLADEVTAEIEPFSRHVKANDRDTLSALALLPAALMDGVRSTRLDDYRALIERRLDVESCRTVMMTELVRHWPEIGANPNKRALCALAELTERIGFGVEPDARHLVKTPDVGDAMAFFRLAGPSTSPSRDLLGCLALVRLGMAVSAVDGAVTAAEELRIVRFLGDALSLGENDRRRLLAHLLWSRAQLPSAAELKARVEHLSPEQRQLAAHFLLAVAGADGSVSPKEVTILTRVYRLLGLDEHQVHADLHRAARPAPGPVPIIPADQEAGLAIPLPPAEPNGAIALNPAVLRQVLDETKRVGTVLESVFAEAEESPEPADEPMIDDDPSTVAGLDAAHAVFVLALTEHPIWHRADLERVARGCGLMLGGAIEVVNELSLDRFDAPLLDGTDPVEIDGDLLRGLLNDR